MPRRIDQRHVRFIVMDCDDETGGMLVQDIVEPKIGCSPYFWRTWLRAYSGRPAARVHVESILADGTTIHRRTVQLAQYCRPA